ncbi:chemotaxis signal transduction protein [Paucimonas lemoignei]|uniref:Chemotaxis signal transduction protein n=1 Tax=Paucimonas lemoignei TaxID=29443 RepID=A0A4R3HYV2_PAULE|nr:chemotaxis protein CheW [Paucimonas lemoignei]TCS37415.1 chemotaxis signal transduction protein [Paucimonas lemoignei]
MDKSTPLQIDNFLPYMRDVTRCEQSLHELNLMWRMIEASAKMNCPNEAKAILPTMAATREGFNRLEQELVTSLVREKVATVLAKIGAKAQYVIDIVVRNLYERTADVGFLATDRKLCEFVAGDTDDVAAIRYRLRAYRNKYTVYDEILLLDTKGNVLVQIDEESPVEGSVDPLIAQSLRTAGYVQTFRATDLRPSKKQALIYSQRMLHPQTGEVVGVLCLCFNFEEEMAGIFRSLREEEDRFNMLLLDGGNRVIASADRSWIDVGAVVPVNRDGSSRLMVYGGREYLVRTFSAAGYQGYMGPPGWQGQVMIPVEVAFTGEASHALDDLGADSAEGLLSHARSFCPPLFEIMTAADTIRRVVWNGQVMTAGQHGELQKLKTILEQIGETGSRSNELFSQSIRDLYQTVIGSNLNDAEFVSHLLVDLLDRNLYERSDDCRWWALTPELRLRLAEQELDLESTQQITAILDYINRLYTVYTRIFVYDRDGVIIASSRDGEGDASIVGTMLDAETLAQVTALRGEQNYHVSAFSSSQLYDGAPTYIYHAAIRDPHHDGMVVGGIGLVFDSTIEFSAMLQSCLAGKEAAHAFYIDRQGRIISSTDPARPVGSMLEIDPGLLKLPNGSGASRIVEHDGHYAVMGCTVSSGYREFKKTDGYVDDVLAVVFTYFGQVRQIAAKSRQEAIVDAGSGGHEFATFFVNGAMFAIDAEHAQQALPVQRISRVSIGGRSERVGIISLEQQGEEKRYAWVYDLGHLMRGTPSPMEAASQVIIVKHGDQMIGLLVEDLHGVPEFEAAQIVATPLANGAGGMLITQVIKANGGDLLIQVINIDYLFAVLSDPLAPNAPLLPDAAAVFEMRLAA